MSFLYFHFSSHRKRTVYNLKLYITFNQGELASYKIIKMIFTNMFGPSGLNAPCNRIYAISHLIWHHVWATHMPILPICMSHGIYLVVCCFWVLLLVSQWTHPIYLPIFVQTPTQYKNMFSRYGILMLMLRWAPIQYKDVVLPVWEIPLWRFACKSLAWKLHQTH